MAQFKTIIFLNVLFVVTGLILAGASIWYFLQVDQFIRLRNLSHYLLNFEVHLPQAVPWVFFVSAVLFAAVALIGLIAASRSSRSGLKVYAVLMGIVITLMIVLSVVVIIFGNGEDSRTFIKETVFEAYSEAKKTPQVLAAYGDIERKWRCCGANSARDYSNWMDTLPLSCCEEGSFVCDRANRHANIRFGCGIVATEYAMIATYSFAAVNLFLALLAIFAVVQSIRASKEDKMAQIVDKIIVNKNNETAI